MIIHILKSGAVIVLSTLILSVGRIKGFVTIAIRTRALGVMGDEKYYLQKLL